MHLLSMSLRIGGTDVWLGVMWAPCYIIVWINGDNPYQSALACIRFVPTHNKLVLIYNNLYSIVWPVQTDIYQSVHGWGSTQFGSMPGLPPDMLTMVVGGKVTLQGLCWAVSQSPGTSIHDSLLTVSNLSVSLPLHPLVCISTSSPLSNIFSLLLSSACISLSLYMVGPCQLAQTSTNTKDTLALYWSSYPT